MSRRLAPGRLVIATHNAGKLREIAALVAPFGVEVVSAGALVEVQASAEGAAFHRADLDAMLALAQKGIADLVAIQKAALG